MRTEFILYKVHDNDMTVVTFGWKGEAGRWQFY